MKKSRGILPIFIALIVAGSLGIVGGGYTGARYYQSTKYEKKAERSFKSGNYTEALDYYNKSLTFWKRKKVEEKKVIAEKESNFLVNLSEGIGASGQNKWQECIDKLKNISSDSKSYSLAQTLTHDCQVKVDEEAAAKRKVEEEATIAEAEKNKTAQSAPKKSATSTRTQSTSSAPSSTQPPDTSSSNTPSSSSANSNSCTSNTNPVFTHHVTDLSKVDDIAIPPRMIGGDLKAHSYINSNHQRVPVYAPAPIKLIGGVHLSHGTDPSDYGMDFQVSCDVKIRIGHITEPVQSLKDILGAAVADSRNGKSFNPPTLSFAAGDLIGYTTGTAAAGNWDFGTYNSSAPNRYATDPIWNWSSIYTTGVCPYDYYSPSLKSLYTSKYIQDFGVSTHDGIFFCN